MNKKGIIPDLQYIIITFFVFLMFFGLASLMWYHFNYQVQNLPSDVAGAWAKGKVDSMGYIFTFMDKLVPFIFLILWVLVLFFSVTVAPDHPIFYIISLAALILTTLLAIVFADLGTALFSNTVFTPVVASLSNTIFFAENYHYISFVIMLISLVIFFSKNRLTLNQGIQ